jgi:hypothetical protein
MPRRAECRIVLVMTLSLLADRASAVVTREPVTPASVKETDSKFSVKAEKRQDGLIHFTVTYSLPRPQYLVAHFELRDGDTTLVKTDTPGFVREAAATYHVAVSPKHMANSRFELSWNAFRESGGQPVPLPGGTIYEIDLEAFGKNAPAAAEALPKRPVRTSPQTSTNQVHATGTPDAPDVRSSE